MSTAMLDPLEDRDLVHETTQDGRERHYFIRVEGVFRCECGLSADRFGKHAT